MMTVDTRRHIDAARQVLVGVVPNPTSQIEQITNALIYKFMDDMDQAAIKAGGKPSFFVKDLERYAWTRLMDPKLGNQERMNLYAEALLKFSDAKQLPPLFRDIFKSAILPYRSPETLGLFLKEIDFFDYSHPEELGNSYEYLLSIMSSQGDAGQFRTPRHIIDFIVEVVNPTKDNKVLDPACGTGGFLVKSYQHILGQHNDIGNSKKKNKPLTPDERKKIMNNFEGYDIDPGMVRIAQVNMYLHQFKSPKIFQYDSLSSEERWNDKFDVILANPPFMSPRGGIRPHNKFSVKSNRSEVLFVDYIMNHLRPKGRAGIIVPEGIIFQSGNSYKELRKNLIEDGLYAVVSLPSGVFAPYSGVKTSILLFDNELSKQSKEILFIKIENDGFDLGATKRIISKNDLPQAIEVLNKWRKCKKVENPLAVYVKKSKIAENGDYNLSIDRYRVATDYSNAKWQMVELGEVCDLESGSRDKGGSVNSGVYSIGGEQINADNSIRFEKMKYITEAHFSEMKRGILIKGDVLMVKDGATTGKMGYWDFDYKAAVNEHVFIFRSKVKILPKYLYSVLISDSFQHELKPYIKGIIGGISLEIKKIKIPLPPVEIQTQIVEQVRSYQNIIDGVKQTISNWKPNFIVDPEWKIFNLDVVCTQITDGTHITPKYINSGVPFLRVTDITLSNESKKYISREQHKEFIKRCNPEKGDVLYTKNGTIGIAKMVDWDYKFSIFVSLALLKPKKEILDGKYLEYFLNSDLALAQAKAHSKAGTVTNLHLIEIKQFKIPIPPITVQRQIVANIEVEHAAIEQAKNLKNIFEKKIKDIIAKVWES